jgi:hypothetical protein
MSTQTQSNNQQIIVIGLIVIAALLAGIVGVIVYQQTRAIPATTADATQTQTQTPQTNTQSPATPAGDFDPKAATKVPKGTDPEAYVKAYYTACDKGDWQAAFDALPTAKKANNSPDALKQQVTGYGIKSFAITDSKVEGDKATVTVDQVTGQYGTFVNTWTFVKKDGTWLVESKAVTGMK